MSPVPTYKHFLLRAIVLVALSLFSIAGCFIHHADYGNYRLSREVDGIFASGRFPAEYAYYYAHTHSDPKALIGIRPEYTLNNQLWTRVAPSELKRLLDNMWVRSAYSPFIYGSYIVSPEGKPIGIYYSQYNGGPVVMGPDNQVIVNLPNIERMRPRFPSLRFFRDGD